MDLDTNPTFHFSARPFEESVDVTTTVTAAAGHLTLAYSGLGSALDEAILTLGAAPDFHVLEPMPRKMDRVAAGLAQEAGRAKFDLGRVPEEEAAELLKLVHTAAMLYRDAVNRELEKWMYDDNPRAT